MAYNGFRVDIECTLGGVKCDVIALKGSKRRCIEVEFLITPPQFILNPLSYSIARHVVKLIRVYKAGIDKISFAYPVGIIPPIPLELLRPPNIRSSERLIELIAIARKFYAVEENALDVLKRASIDTIIFFNLEKGDVAELQPQQIEVLITMYESFFHRFVS